MSQHSSEAIQLETREAQVRAALSTLAELRRALITSVPLPVRLALAVSEIKERLDVAILQLGGEL